VIAVGTTDGSEDTKNGVGRGEYSVNILVWGGEMSEVSVD
jgi:hypothetical protein